jgi:hypothetical protein
LDDVLAPDPIALDEAETEALARTVAQFDATFLDQQWDQSDNVLLRSAQFDHTFDHQFRRMLHAIYTADQARLDAVLPRLHGVYGEQIVSHLYSGYCSAHGIPNRMSGG